VRQIVLLLVAVAAAGAPGPSRRRPDGFTPDTPKPAVVSVRTRLDLKHLSYDLDHVELFRPSAFLNPRTAAGLRAYAELGDHYAARLFAAFSWPMSRSTSLSSFREQLRERGRSSYAQWASQAHEKLLITIDFTPDWLSSSNDDRQVEGFYKRRNTRAPRDYDQWKLAVRELVGFYRQFGGAQKYYEVWNEPDLEYWKDDLDAYLRIYAETVSAVKSADPDARVGGSATNSWKGKANPSDRDSINMALIRFAKERSLPLDFVSWHTFSASPRVVHEAASAFRAAFRDNGYTKNPELVISEWNVPQRLRNTADQASAMADLLVSFREAGVDLQTVAAWENFHPDPDSEGYGMVRYGGERKSAYYLLRAFAAAAQDSQGIVIIREKEAAPREGERKLVISKKADDRYLILMWENGFDPPTAAAMTKLAEDGFSETRLFQDYGSLLGIERAIQAGQPKDPHDRELFGAARKVYETYPTRTRLAELEFAGTDEIEVIEAIGIKDDVRVVPARVTGSVITLPLDKREVLRLELRLKRREELQKPRRSAGTAPSG
jgi:hypothetical protein